MSLSIACLAKKYPTPIRRLQAAKHYKYYELYKYTGKILGMDQDIRDSSGRWVKGRSGNPEGRKPGVSDWRNKYREALDTVAPEIINSIINAALQGDSTAQRICMERLIPPLKATDSPVTVPLIGGLGEQGRVVLQSIADGELTPGEAESVFRSLSAQARISEISELEKRIEALETTT